MSAEDTGKSFSKVPVRAVIDYGAGDEHAIDRAKVFGFIVGYQMRLARHGYCPSPTVQQISSGVGMGRTKVYRVVQMLADEGSLEVQKRRNRYSPGGVGYRNHYRVIDDGPARGLLDERYVEVPPRVLRKGAREVGVYVLDQAQVFADDIATLSAEDTARLLRCSARWVRTIRRSVGATVHAVGNYRMRATDYMDRRYGVEVHTLREIDADVLVSQRSRRAARQLRRLHVLVKNLNAGGLDGWREVGRAVAAARAAGDGTDPHITVVIGYAAWSNAKVLTATWWIESARSRFVSTLRAYARQLATAEPPEPAPA